MTMGTVKMKEMQYLSKKKKSLSQLDIENLKFKKSKLLINKRIIENQMSHFKNEVLMIVKKIEFKYTELIKFTK